MECIIWRKKIYIPLKMVGKSNRLGLENYLWNGFLKPFFILLKWFLICRWLPMIQWRLYIYTKYLIIYTKSYIFRNRLSENSYIWGYINEKGFVKDSLSWKRLVTSTLPICTHSCYWYENKILKNNKACVWRRWIIDISCGVEVKTKLTI